MKNFIYLCFVCMCVLSAVNTNAQIVTSVAQKDVVKVIDKFNVVQPYTPYGYIEVIKCDSIYSLQFETINQFEDYNVVIQLGTYEQAPNTLKAVLEIFNNCSNKKNGPTDFADAAGHMLTAYKSMGGYYLEQVGIAKSHNGHTVKAINLNNIKKILFKFENNKYE